MHRRQDTQPRADASAQTRSQNSCPECGDPVVERRVTCPNCGYEYGREDYAKQELDDEFSTEMSRQELDREGMLEDSDANRGRA